MQIAYSNNEAKKFDREVNSIRKGFKPQPFMIKGKKGKTASNKKKVLLRKPEN